MDQSFYVSSQWRVVICKQCQHAVWPSSVAGHLKGIHHRVSGKEASRVKQEVQESPVIQDPTDFDPIDHVDKPIPELKVYYDGWTCTTESTCNFTALATSSLKKYCTQQHAGSRPRTQYRRAGNPSNPWVRVTCQQMFTNSHAKAKLRVRAAQQEMRQRTTQGIQDRQEGTEYVPWLETMGWPTYLEGLDHQGLMDLVETPDAEDEALVSIVWDAMDSMLRHSQQTVKKHAGYYLCMEVVRSEAKQTKYRPLQPYMHADAVKDYARP
ncbi:hypothetical protein Q9189_008267 [Teloschistes chrysophthalmus]